MDPAIPWYQSAIVRQQITQLVVALTAVLGVNLGGLDVSATVTSIFAGIAALIAVWTIITRIVKPAPNLSVAAAKKEADMKAAGTFTEPKVAPSRQGGFFRFSLLVFVGLGALGIASLLPGCASTASAYKAATTLSDTAYVVAEHYAAVVKEAADVAALPTTDPQVKAAMKAADNAVRPFILGDPATGKPSLRELAAQYSAVRNAQTEAELQAAVNSAVIELARLINAVKAARR